MKNDRFFEGLAVLGLVAAATIPFAASQAHDGEHKFSKKWSKDLAERIEIKVREGMKKGAVGMEKGADKMLKGADKMEAYAGRLERDPEFRAAEAEKQNKWNDKRLTADGMLKKASEMRRGAEEMREGAAEMREAAEKMRQGDT